MADIGDLLTGKYRLNGLLGEGGMGAVYEARHEQIGKRVAVKVLHPELTRVTEASTRFTREAQASAAIGHRGIIDIYDIGESEKDGSIFLVMELLEGENLGDLLERERPLGVQLACYVVCQVLSALDAAHSAGIVHRDLKPDNIFLVRSGQKLPEVKLLDFGISKMVDSSNPEARLTRTGIAMGTPYYMSPEQAVGAKDLDHRVDIWAMGVILFECLTGKVPFTADNSLAILRMITDAPIESPREHRPEIPSELEAVILRAMNRDLERRFRSSLEMLSVLLPLLEEHIADRISLPQGFESNALMETAAPTQSGRPPPVGASSEEHPASWPAVTGSIENDEALESASKPKTGGVTSVTWERSETSVSKRAGATRALVIGAIVLLVGVVVGVAAFWSSTRANRVSADATTSHVSGAAHDEREVQESSTISIEIKNLPRGAHVFLDGEQMREHPMKLPRSDSRHELAVEAEGYLRWTKTIRASDNIEITASLELDVADLATPVKQDQRAPAAVESRGRAADNRAAEGRHQTKAPVAAPSPSKTTKTGPRYGRELLPERPSYGSEL